MTAERGCHLPQYRQRMGQKYLHNPTTRTNTISTTTNARLGKSQLPIISMAAIRQTSPHSQTTCQKKCL
jgi:hypothetical protein